MEGGDRVVEVARVARDRDSDGSDPPSDGSDPPEDTESGKEQLELIRSSKSR